MKSRRTAEPRPAPYCVCGCGEIVNWSYRLNRWNKYIHGHSRRKYVLEKSKTPPLCECGCNERVKWNEATYRWNKFIFGHQNRGKNNPNYGRKTSEETIKKMRITLGDKLSGPNNPNWKGGGREVNCSFCHKKINLPRNYSEHKNYFCDQKCHMKWVVKNKTRSGKNNPFSKRKNIEKTRKRMSGPVGAYVRAHAQNPSKPQVELFKLIKTLYPTAILNYPSLNRNIDIAIPENMVVIEYDSSWWHQDQDYDDKRQKQLEDVGWKFVRYLDYVPDIDKIKEDINEIIRRGRGRGIFIPGR